MPNNIYILFQNLYMVLNFLIELLSKFYIFLLQIIQLLFFYYEAVFHLSKYPCLETEESLLTLLKSEDKSQAIVIARRKSIEVLARIGCKRAMPLIAKTLDSDDPYVVENATWALQELNCTDTKVHKSIGKLLEKPNQNQSFQRFAPSQNVFSQILNFDTLNESFCGLHFTERKGP